MDKKKKSKVVTQLTLFESINHWLEKYLTRIFWASFILTLVFGILLFDIRFSLAGDDSAYVIRAYDFIHHFIFPGFQGPLYPIVLSPLVALFGLSPVPLKSLSMLFMLGFIWFFYKAFRKRIPALLVTSLLLLVSVNSFILYYASQTYSETFFMFLEAMAFWVFFTFFIDPGEVKPTRTEWSHQLILALCILSLGITRSIGFSAVFAVSLYFLLQKQWKELVRFILAFILVMALYQGVKYLLWGSAGLQFNEQGQRLMYKDFYTPALGMEDFPGYVNRLIVNSNFFLSSSFYSILGLRSDDPAPVLYPFITVFTGLLMIASVVLTFRRNKYLLFTGLYVMIFLVNTFILLQTTWCQPRLIIPYWPLLALMIFGGLYYLFTLKKMSSFSWLLPVLLVIISLLTLAGTFAKVSYTRQITNRYFGLTPDWENYCKASEWASQHLPQDAVIACRKPTVSFIYGNGRRFFGINEIKSYAGSSLIKAWQDKGQHYYFISAAAMEKTFPTELYRQVTGSVVAFGTNVASGADREIFRFYVMDFSDSLKDQISGELARLDIHPAHSIDSLKLYLSRPGENMKIIYPDTLLNILLKGNVTHILEGNLRRTPSKKNGLLINTVRRLMIYMTIKYPELLTRIIQIGADNNEPAEILRLNYENYGLKPAQQERIRVP